MRRGYYSDGQDALIQWVELNRAPEFKIGLSIGADNRHKRHKYSSICAA